MVCGSQYKFAGSILFAPSLITIIKNNRLFPVHLSRSPPFPLSFSLSILKGGGTGIGRAVCKLLAKEGASVAVAGNILSDCNETVAIIKEDSGHSTASCHPFEVDVCDSGQVSALFAALGRHFTGNCVQWSFYVVDDALR